MSIRDVNDVSCLVRPAHVLCGSEFRAAPPELGDDLFLCDYEYNEMWQVGWPAGGRMGWVCRWGVQGLACMSAVRGGCRGSAGRGLQTARGPCPALQKGNREPRDCTRTPSPPGHDRGSGGDPSLGPTPRMTRPTRGRRPQSLEARRRTRTCKAKTARRCAASPSMPCGRKRGWCRPRTCEARAARACLNPGDRCGTFGQLVTGRDAGVSCHRLCCRHRELPGAVHSSPTFIGHLFLFVTLSSPPPDTPTPSLAHTQK